MTKKKSNSKRKTTDSSSGVGLSERRVSFESPNTKKPRHNKGVDSREDNETCQGFSTAIPDNPKGFKKGESSVSPNTRPRCGKGKTFVRKKQSTRGHTSTSQSVDVNNKLPARVFSVTNLPDHGRLNIYSKPEYLGRLVELLQGSTAWDRLIHSQFGKLFELPVSRCSHSAKLIHGMLSRQLVTGRKHELWFVYGGFPVRFSLREFHIITGLQCGALPSESEVEDHQDPSCLSVWNRLFGATKIVTVSNVLDLLREDQFAVGSKRFSEWKKLSLALLVIIDGVIAVNNQLGRVTARYVEMLHDIDFFMSFPWGREAYNQTIKRFGPLLIGNKPDIEDLKSRLGQCSSCCYGFPVALQLQVLQTIPVICDRVKGSNDLRNFLQRPSESLSTNNHLRESHINQTELLPNVSVKYTVFTSEELTDDNLSWHDEANDPKVDLVLSMLNENHRFHPDEWPVFQCSNSTPNSPDSDDDDVIDITPVPVGKGRKKPIPENSEDITRKRKREENLCSDASVKDSKAKDTTRALPFEKKLPIWKTLESMEVFKTVPQSPHFSPLAETSEDSRETSAVGMMLTFSGLLDEVKALKRDDSISSFISLGNSFAELEKHGFSVKEPQLRINKLLSLRDRQATKIEELKGAGIVIAEKESVKVELERKILELRRLDEEADKELTQSKLCAAKIVQELEDVKLEFQTTASAPW